MKVVLVGPVYPFRGGIAHYTTMISRAFQAEGHDLLLVSFKRQYPRLLFPGRTDKDPSRDYLAVQDVKFWIDSLNPISWLWAYWRIHRFRPEVVVLPWWTTFWTPVWYCFGLLNHLLGDSPITFICHNVLPHERHAVDPWLTRLGLRWGNQFIVQSSDEAQLLRSLRPRAKIKILPHPVYDFSSHHRIPQPEARRKLNLPKDGLVFLFFGIVRKYKGLMELLELWPVIRSELGKAILVIAGEFWEAKGLYLTRIKELGLEGAVVIDDRYIPNEELGIYFSAADAVLAPYLQTTGSGVAQIARGFGKPVVTRPVGSSPGKVDRQILVEIRKALCGSQRSAAGGEAARGPLEEPTSTWPDLVRLICRQ